MVGRSIKFDVPEIDMPGIPNFNPMQILHGEESMYFEKPIQPNMKYKTSQKLIDIQDKVKATVTINEMKIIEADTGDLAVTLHRTTFIKGIGGFGYKGKIKSPIPALPKTAPQV